MDFWETAKKVGKVVKSELEEQKESIQNWKARYERLDDEELKKRFLKSSGNQRIALMLLLKERGLIN